MTWRAISASPYPEGPHTVRFRYLVSRGNNRRLTVSARSDAAGRKQSAAVLFPEPYRFDSLDQYTWAYSPPAMLRMQAGRIPLVKLGTDGAIKPGTLSPEHGQGTTNAELDEVTEQAKGKGETTLEDEMVWCTLRNADDVDVESATKCLCVSLGEETARSTLGRQTTLTL